MSCEVFVAPELDAIEQCPPGEDPKISLGNSGVLTFEKRCRKGKLVEKSLGKSSFGLEKRS